MSDRLDAELYGPIARLLISNLRRKPVTTAIRPAVFIFNMGDKVKDVINGYEGVVAAAYEPDPQAKFVGRTYDPKKAS